ncbi:hypothetical protein COLO4_01042, partial [Corchorus olitorius]
AWPWACCAARLSVYGWRGARQRSPSNRCPHECFCRAACIDARLRAAGTGCAQVVARPAAAVARRHPQPELRPRADVAVPRRGSGGLHVAICPCQPALGGWLAPGCGLGLRVCRVGSRLLLAAPHAPQARLSVGHPCRASRGRAFQPLAGRAQRVAVVADIAAVLRAAGADRRHAGNVRGGVGPALLGAVLQPLRTGRPLGRVGPLHGHARQPPRASRLQPGIHRSQFRRHAAAVGQAVRHLSARAGRRADPLWRAQAHPQRQPVLGQRGAGIAMAGAAYTAFATRYAHHARRLDRHRRCAAVWRGDRLCAHRRPVARALASGLVRAHPAAHAGAGRFVGWTRLGTLALAAAGACAARADDRHMRRGRCIVRHVGRCARIAWSCLRTVARATDRIAALFFAACRISLSSATLHRAPRRWPKICAVPRTTICRHATTIVLPTRSSLPRAPSSLWYPRS